MWSGLASKHLRDGRLVDSLHRVVHSKVSRRKRHCAQDSDQPNREVQLERLLEEHVELRGDKACNDDSNHDAEDASRHNNQESFIHEDPAALVLRDTHRSQNTVLPHIVFNVWGRCNQQEEESQDQADYADDAHNECEHNIDCLQWLDQSIYINDEWLGETFGETRAETVDDQLACLRRDVRTILNQQAVLRDLESAIAVKEDAIKCIRIVSRLEIKNDLLEGWLGHHTHKVEMCQLLESSEDKTRQLSQVWSSDSSVFVITQSRASHAQRQSSSNFLRQDRLNTFGKQDWHLPGEVLLIRKTSRVWASSDVIVVSVVWRVCCQTLITVDHINSIDLAVSLIVGDILLEIVRVVVVHVDRAQVVVGHCRDRDINQVVPS